MTKRRRRKCLNCWRLFRPDPRNLRHQRYCSAGPYRKASKAASQARYCADGLDRHHGNTLASIAERQVVFSCVGRLDRDTVPDPDGLHRVKVLVFIPVLPDALLQKAGRLIMVWSRTSRPRLGLLQVQHSPSAPLRFAFPNDRCLPATPIAAVGTTLQRGRCSSRT